MTKNTSKRDAQLKRLLRRSHEMQFNGKDWQVAVNDLLPELENWTDDEANYLSSRPDTECDCGYCRTAEWSND